MFGFVAIELAKMMFFHKCFKISVLSSCEEPKEMLLKQATVEENFVLSSTADESEITVPLIEISKTTESTNETFNVTDIPTAATILETEVTENVTDDQTVDTTIGDNSTNITDSDGEKTETFPEDTTITESVTPNITTVEATTETELATEIISTEVTEIITKESTATEISTESTTTTTTTELPTTPIDLLCPQVAETAIDAKYRNETFDLYFEEFMKRNPSAQIYKSPGFPGPYAANLNCTLRFVDEKLIETKF